MPTYQYACTNAGCGNRFELVQSFTDPAASECPACDQPVRKVYGSVGVVFKGSGFYRTDSRSGNGKSDTVAASSSASGDSSSSSSSSSSSAGDSAGSSSSKSPAPASTGSGSGSGSGKVAASA